MIEKGKYVYGIINSHSIFHLYVPRDLPGDECGSNDVYTIPYHDISLLVKDCEIFDYSAVPNDIGIKMLLKHQEIIERIMNSGMTVIPVKLGTFIQDEADIKNVLNKGYNLIKKLLNKINDKIEIDVVVTWNDFNSAIKETTEENEIKEFKSKLLASSKEIALDDRIKIGLMINEILEKRREKYSSEIHDILKKISEDVKVHDIMDEKMILNMAFLVSKNKLQEFETGINLLNIKFNNKLNFRCIGPLPAYSFYTLEIKKLHFEKIDWARRKLGIINNFVTKEEIKRAYQTLIVTSHPDNNRNIPGVEIQFEEITNAHNILEEYCQQDTCSFREEEFNKNDLLVRIRE